MAEINVRVPDQFANLPEDTREQLLRAGVHEATRAWIRQLESELADADAEIERYEERYGATFAEFEAEQLPNLDALEAHEDYNDWFYWEQIAAEKRSLLETLRSTLS